MATARRLTALDDLATAHPGRVDVLPLDVTDPVAIDAAVKEVIARHGRIDVLGPPGEALRTVRPDWTGLPNRDSGHRKIF